MVSCFTECKYSFIARTSSYNDYNIDVLVDAGLSIGPSSAGIETKTYFVGCWGFGNREMPLHYIQPLVRSFARSFVRSFLVRCCCFVFVESIQFESSRSCFMSLHLVVVLIDVACFLARTTDSYSFCVVCVWSRWLLPTTGQFGA